MSERDIRARLRAAFEELDRRAGRAVRKIVLPCALGAGLALAASGCDGRPAPGDASTADALAQDALARDALAHDALAHDALAHDQAVQRVDWGVQPPYMAPSYMAPPPWDLSLGPDVVSDPSADYAAPYPPPQPAPDAGR